MRSGASLAELMIAAGILAFGLVPVISGIQSTAREARFLEFRSQAVARARGLLGAAQVLGTRVFEKAAGSGEATLNVALPAGGAGAVGKTVVDRIGYLDEKVTVREAASAGRAKLYVLAAVVRWVHPAEPNRPQEVRLVTLQGDPLASINQESP